jgi:regulator of protease activity HflC (stomatin/prohibitin superfamily)
MDFRDLFSKEVTLNNRNGQPVTDRVLQPFRVVGLVVATIALVIALITVWPFYSVPTGSRGVVTQFGKIVGVENEGLAILPPWQKLSVFSIRAEQADIDKAEGSTSDQQPVIVSLTVRYSISTDKVSEVFEKYSHNGDLASYVQTASQDVFKAITAKYTAPDLIAQRAKVASDINSALGDKLKIYGAQVINIDMRNFSFQESYMKAINDKVTQEQLRLAADNKLKTVESEQKQKVAIAEAEANAVKATADGEAYATVQNAKAQAEALRVQGAAIRENPQILELRRIDVSLKQVGQGWDGKLPVAMYANSPVPFLNLGK